jgi:hypothetical protein
LVLAPQPETIKDIKKMHFHKCRRRVDFIAFSPIFYG